MYTQQEFEREYRIVRRLLVKGKYDLDIAKAWLKIHSAKVVETMQGNYTALSLRRVKQSFPESLSMDKESDDE